MSQLFRIKPLAVGLAALALAVVFFAPPARAAVAIRASPELKLNWNGATQRVSADIEDAPVDRVLQEVRRQTKWDVRAEPGLNLKISSSFTDLPQGEALARLFSGCSYALIPGDDGRPQLLVYETSLNLATVRILPTQVEARPIPNELIVKLKPGVDPDEFAARYGAEIIGRIDDLRIYVLRFPDAASMETARAAMSEDKEVEWVENNYEIDRPQFMRSDLAVPFANVSLRPEINNDDCRLIIALIDTPLHAPGEELKGFYLDPISVNGEPVTPDGDQPTHGDFMANALLKAAEAVLGGNSQSSLQILPVDAYGESETTNTGTLSLALYRALQNNPDIVNISSGSYASSAMMEELVRYATSQGVQIFAANGNDPVADPVYPAAYEPVTSVAAGDLRGGVMPFANLREADLIEPGISFYERDGTLYYTMGSSPASATAAGKAAAQQEQAGGCQ